VHSGFFSSHLTLLILEECQTDSHPEAGMYTHLQVIQPVWARVMRFFPNLRVVILPGLRSIDALLLP
jgi:hypothetical protein